MRFGRGEIGLQWGQGFFIPRTDAGDFRVQNEGMSWLPTPTIIIPAPCVPRSSWAQEGAVGVFHWVYEVF